MIFHGQFLHGGYNKNSKKTKEVDAMKKYICSVCGFIYDEAKGIPEVSIAPGTKWKDLPDDWLCPLCGAADGEFREQRSQASMKKTLHVMETPTDMEGADAAGDEHSLLQFGTGLCKTVQI